MSKLLADDAPLVGLPEPARSERVADFFDRFAWAGVARDPKVMRASDFLDAVLRDDGHAASGPSTRSRPGVDGA